MIANSPFSESANDALQLEQEAPVQEIPAQADPAYAQVVEEVSLETHTPVSKRGMDPTASQRLKTVRALNENSPPSLREPKKRPNADAAAYSAPVSIEDQINTSITQTLKALKVPSHLIDDDDEPEEENTKNGFFSRFRRS